MSENNKEDILNTLRDEIRGYKSRVAKEYFLEVLMASKNIQKEEVEKGKKGDDTLKAIFACKAHIAQTALDLILTNEYELDDNSLKLMDTEEYIIAEKNVVETADATINVFENVEVENE